MTGESDSERLARIGTTVRFLYARQPRAMADAMWLVERVEARLAGRLSPQEKINAAYRRAAGPS